MTGLGRIYLIPCIIAPDTQEKVVSPWVRQVISEVEYYLVENVRTARRFISSLKVRPVDELVLELYNKNTTAQQLEELLSPLKKGQAVGVISEAGCPAIADPGNNLVMWAHHNGILVTPMTGPSSITLALMASGLNGQHFEFHGYLPIEKSLLLRKLKALEKEASTTGKTQIFMETPYRNQKLVDAILKNCNRGTALCIASDLTSKNECVKTMTVKQWRSNPPQIHKKPAIFLLGGAAEHI